MACFLTRYDSGDVVDDEGEGVAGADDDDNGNRAEARAGC